MLCQAVAFVQCNGAVLRGKVAEMRDQLRPLLPGTPEFPEYATQDDVCDDVTDCDDDDDSCESEPHVAIDIKSVDDLTVGECIEVWWKGEKEWFEAEVVDICSEDKTYEVLYHSDSQRLWQTLEDYSARYAC